MRRNFVLLAAAGLSGFAALSSAHAGPAPEAISAAQAELAWRLIDGMAKDGDPVVSPASLASAFAVLAEGADDKMKAALVKTLGFAANANALAELRAARSTLAAADPTIFISKDRIVFAPAIPPSPDMQRRLKALNAPWSVGDLTDEKTIDEINAWVRSVTKGMIPSLLGGPLPPDALLVGLNALHFKAKWADPFDKKLTAEQTFFAADGKQAQTSMMHSGRMSRSFRTDGDFIGVDLAFAGSRYSLVVVTTSDAPKPLAAFAPISAWLSGSGFSTQEGTLALPKFSLEGGGDLLPVLNPLGLADAASPTAFEGFAPPDRLKGKPVEIGAIIQKAKIEADEEGAKAAAATSVEIRSAMARPSLPPIAMVVDKPFLFALRDRESGLVLIAGFVSHAPTAPTD